MATLAPWKPSEISVPSRVLARPMPELFAGGGKPGHVGEVALVIVLEQGLQGVQAGTPVGKDLVQRRKGHVGIVLGRIQGKRGLEIWVLAMVEGKPAGENDQAHFRRRREGVDVVHQGGDHVEAGFVRIELVHASGVVDDEDDGRRLEIAVGDLDELVAERDLRVEPDHLFGDLDDPFRKFCGAFRERHFADPPCPAEADGGAHDGGEYPRTPYHFNFPSRDVLNIPGGNENRRRIQDSGLVNLEIALFFQKKPKPGRCAPPGKTAPLACINLNVEFLGTEIDNRYIEIANENIQLRYIKNKKT